MASVVTRKHKSGERTYKVQWLLGGHRGAPWQSETFTDRRAALKFAALVDAGGQRWPDSWVKGVGFGEAPEEPAEEHPLLEFGTAYVRRLTNKRRYVSTLRLRGRRCRHRREYRDCAAGRDFGRRWFGPAP